MIPREAEKDDGWLRHPLSEGLDLRLRELSGVGRSGRSELGLVTSESGYGKRWQSQI